MTASTELDRLCAELGLAEVPASWRATWNLTATFDDDMPVLDPSWVAAAGQAIGLEAEATRALGDAASELAQRPGLIRLMRHCHHELFVAREPAPGSWPTLPGTSAADRLFHALVLLSGWPRLERRHRARGIPSDITRATLADFAMRLREHQRKHGQWGLDAHGWLSRHFRDRIYQLGRLQFETAGAEKTVHVYQDDDGEVALLAAPGSAFRADGLLASAFAGDAPVAFTAALSIDAVRIVGHPFDRDGLVRAEPIVLDARRWRCVLRPGDPVLAVHITAYGPMDDAACSASFAQALDFFPKHVPEHPFAAFTCVSWLMDGQLARWLPADGNIVRFLRRYHLFPIEGADATQHFERIFGGAVDLATAPQATQLQRVLVAHLRAGGRWHRGGGLILRGG
ncbi:MAG: DUF5596 domain-containing protein [Planctomycetes bacterium]|nr:DUF5596 domain-containing protein [Planctomycetota bacterium]